MQVLYCPQPKVLLTQEKWEEFGRAYRAEFDFCRMLQIDYIAACARFFESGMDQSEGRAMVHCFGSLLDGLTGAMRTIAVATCRLFGRPLNPFLQEKAEERNITAHRRVYTTYRLLAEFRPGSPLATTSDALWDDLHTAIEIRNRITHPKSARDLEVSGVDGMLVSEIGDEFNSHLNKFAHWLMQKEQKLIWEHTVERRRLYRKVGRNEPCPCGSGTKHKDCCLRASQVSV